MSGMTYKKLLVCSARLRTLSSFILFACSVMGIGAVTAADEADDVDVEEVLVTGSRIRDVDRSAYSVTQISAEAIDSQGYRNVYDALSAQTQNTGFTQGADFGNTFTPAANAINLRGLGPNHSLVLINGRRVADYPTAYDGQVNFVNLANIPSAAIERIEILNNGASAIYGSDAIAGVANVILKDNLEGLELDLKAGTTERGGGDNWRLQAVGGKSWSRWSTTFAVEISHTDPVWSRQRDFMSSSTLAGASPTNVWSRMDLDTGRYIDPGTVCSALSENFSDATAVFNARQGRICGSGRAGPSFWTVMTENDSQNVYGSARYALSDTTTLFANVIAGFNRTKNNTRGPNWTSAAASGGLFFNQATGHYEAWSRRISPEELGGAQHFNRTWQDEAFDVVLGARGDLGLRDWTYEASYSGSSYLSRNTRPRMLASIDSYFLGPQLGVDESGVPIYAPDLETFNRPLTPDETATLIARTRSRDSSWLQTVALTTNGTVLDLPAGPLKAAGVLEWGTQGFKNRPDSTINEGLYFNTPEQFPVSGSRRRYAAAVELHVPILSQVAATLAGRYDDYSFAGRGDDKLTYNAGLTYRPFASLLLRSNYATTFRAPDMNYIYQTLVRGYFSATTDYYRCQLAGQPLSDCEYADVSPGSNFIQSGNRDLRFENGKSFGYGFVWSPLSRLALSVDYWNIRIDDLVTNVDEDTLLRIEADCRAGARDVSSAQCVDALTRIQRNPADALLNPNGLVNILVNPINASLRRVGGVDAAGELKWSLGTHDFAWAVQFTRVLKHERQQFAGDATEDYLNDLGNVDWRDKVVSDLTWSVSKWSSTLQVSRFGRIPNAAQDAYLTPTTLVNASTAYRYNSHGSVSFIVQNVFDEIKEDTTFGWPFYAVGSYLPYGRQAWLGIDYRF